MKSNPLNIVLIGSGNVATQLGIALKKAKHNIVQVYSQQKSTSLKLATLLNCSATTDIKKINSTADVYIIGVKDDAIKELCKQLKLGDKIIVHTSGSIDITVLKNTSNNTGVFYPLQTISKNKQIDFLTIPICIEASNAKTLNILKKIAQSISNTVHSITSEQRKQIHLAAVFACNFSNYLYTISEKILAENKLPLSLLYPLIEETAIQIKKQSPAQLQTGPAKRGDKKVMQQHLKLLADNKELKNLYVLMSKLIAKTQTNNFS